MSAEKFVKRFKGEIGVQDELSTNAKGGSITVTLKRRIAMALGMANVAAAPALPAKSATSRLAAVTVEIDEANTLLLMTTQESMHSSKFCVRRTGKHSIDISVENQDDDEIDEVAAAFIELKRQQYMDGQLALTTPMTADEFEAMSDAAFEAAKARHS